MAVIELVDQDEDARGQDSGPTQEILMVRVKASLRRSSRLWTGLNGSSGGGPFSFAPRSSFIDDGAYEKIRFWIVPIGTTGRIIGPKHLMKLLAKITGPAWPLAANVGKRNLRSVILWGPPGTGKIHCRLLAGAANMVFEPVLAVFDGVAELRNVFGRAEERRQAGQKTLLFVDEVHRFTKAADGLLPRVEDGTVTLVGATTENHCPNGALLSRARY